MKVIILNTICILFIQACTVPSKNYEGYIYTLSKKPLVNILVCEENRNNCMKTDNKGFFKINKDENSINDLIVYYNNEPVDTIKTVWSQHGEKINYSFVEGRSNTLFVDLK